MLRILKAGHIKQYYILERRKPHALFICSRLHCDLPPLNLYHGINFVIFPPCSSFDLFPTQNFLWFERSSLCTSFLVSHSLNNCQVREEIRGSSTIEEGARCLQVVYPRYNFNLNPV
ncbi:Hypothetical predicted protein [Marmota monax]|uniref:Uncharacterized protein n=1 Tax=Marmota monax TaxID=9995 RepID=A0A5E4CTD8_MARMO|nr:Hypothetical predicted protein [Marmota monax]